MSVKFVEANAEQFEEADGKKGIRLRQSPMRSSATD